MKELLNGLKNFLAGAFTIVGAFFTVLTWGKAFPADGGLDFVDIGPPLARQWWAPNSTVALLGYFLLAIGLALGLHTLLSRPRKTND